VVAAVVVHQGNAEGIVVARRELDVVGVGCYAKIVFFKLYAPAEACLAAIGKARLCVRAAPMTVDGLSFLVSSCWLLVAGCQTNDQKPPWKATPDQLMI